MSEKFTSQKWSGDDLEDINMRIVKTTIVALSLISCGNGPASFRGANTTPTSLSEDGRMEDLRNKSEDGPGPNGEFSEAFYVGESSEEKPVDIVIAMDTSLSMKQEKQALEQNISSFISNLRDANLDIKITAIGDPNQFQFPGDINNDIFAIYPQYIDSYNAIEVTNSFLASPHKPLEMRDDAHLEIIFFSDDNAAGKNRMAENFKLPVDRSTTINAVVGLEKKEHDVNSPCNITNIGGEYIKLAEKTKGKVLDLCSPDWAVLLNTLSDNIIKIESKIFKLSHKPDKSQIIKVYKNGIELKQKDFKIYSSSRQLEILAEVDIDDEIIIDYTVNK